jgi:hypothetical protein
LCWWRPNKVETFTISPRSAWGSLQVPGIWQKRHTHSRWSWTTLWNVRIHFASPKPVCLLHKSIPWLISHNPIKRDPLWSWSNLLIDWSIDPPRVPRSSLLPHSSPLLLVTVQGTAKP